MSATVLSPDLFNPEEYIKWRVANQNETIKNGDLIPDIQLSRNVNATARETFSTLQALSGDCVVLFTVPKAFTPTCSRLHFPGFVAAAEKLHEMGVKRIACLAVNTPDELWKWSAELDPKGLIFMIPDYLGQLVVKIGLAMDKTGERGLGLVAKRSVMILKHGKVDFIGIEDDASKCGISSAEYVLEILGKGLSRKVTPKDERKDEKEII